MPCSLYPHFFTATQHVDATGCAFAQLASVNFEAAGPDYPLETENVERAKVPVQGGRRMHLLRMEWWRTGTSR